MPFAPKHWKTQSPGCNAFGTRKAAGSPARQNNEAAETRFSVGDYSQNQTVNPLPLLSLIYGRYIKLSEHLSQIRIIFIQL